MIFNLLDLVSLKVKNETYGYGKVEIVYTGNTCVGVQINSSPTFFIWSVSNIVLLHPGNSGFTDYIIPPFKVNQKVFHLHYGEGIVEKQIEKFLAVSFSYGSQVVHPKELVVFTEGLKEKMLIELLQNSTTKEELTLVRLNNNFSTSEKIAAWNELSQEDKKRLEKLKEKTKDD